MTARAAARRRRFARFRWTAPPTLRLAVTPQRTAFSCAYGFGVGQTSRVREGVRRLRPWAARTKSARDFIRSRRNRAGDRSGGQLLAALGTPAGQNLAPTLGLHAGAKAVAALAHD